MNKNEELLTTEEVADRYKISIHVQKIFREKQGLPYLRPGSQILYIKAALDLWLKQYSVNEVAEEETA